MPPFNLEDGTGDGLSFDRRLEAGDEYLEITIAGETRYIKVFTPEQIRREV